jgi:acyl-CoA dehydrogenase
MTDPAWLTEDVRVFRDSVRRFVHAEFVPQQARWREQHRPDAEAWLKAGRVGLLLTDVPGVYGGGGGTYAHQSAVIEELTRAGVCFGAGVQSIVAHYILAYGSEDQKRKWLPPMARGELVASIAMTEPGAGSDLAGIRTTAKRDGDHYLINGSKTFITNGWHAGLVCIAAKTNPTAPAMRALSMIVVETKNLPGYRAGRPLEKVGMHGQDTCEMFFENVRVPAANLLGPAEGQGFTQMMQQLPFERLSLAVAAIAMAEEAVAATVRYVKERAVAGKALFELQNTRFKLAECAAEVRVGRAFVDDCIGRYLAGRLDDATAAVAKYWLTERQCRVIDECLQLHGGYGYMAEYPIARMWADSRVQRIYGGTNEIMKEVIAWSL